MRCEMRAATLLRRSGWSEDMFVIGAEATVYGFGHRDDPASCYLEDIAIGDAPEINRNDQFEISSSTDLSDRPLRLASGVPNISEDWAQEQYVIAVPPEGGGSLVPKSMIEAVESGDVAIEDVPSAGWGAPPVRHSGRLHVVERFSLETEPLALTREYVADDPVYFEDSYTGSDTLYPADVPYVPHPCDELAPEFLPARAGDE